jgi:hypothetical protein
LDQLFAPICAQVDLDRIGGGGDVFHFGTSVVVDKQ